MRHLCCALVICIAAPVDAGPPKGGRRIASAPAIRRIRAGGDGPTSVAAPAAAPLSAAAATAIKPNNMMLQAALDRAMFSPGVIDGAVGRKTEMALRAFQKSAGLPVTGIADAATLERLFRSGAARDAETIRYSITREDAALVGPTPTDWNQKAELDSLKYGSLSELASERGRCTRAALARLNPGITLDGLKPGDTVTLPPVDIFDGADEPGPGIVASSLVVDIAEKTVKPMDSAGKPLGLFHCSVAKFAAKRPQGDAQVIKIAFNPEYQFDPAGWPEVRNVPRKLLIPPGPRNPVGLAWIGLSLPGYGIHGTPAPELIGKTGSHGCIRLTNWDAVRLARMVRVGTPVKFVGARG